MNKFSSVVSQLPSGALVLSCGHVVRRRNRCRWAICETCHPAEYARLVQRTKPAPAVVEAKGGASSARTTCLDREMTGERGW